MHSHLLCICGLGKQVAELYQEMAIDQHKGITGYEATRREIIESYKAQGHFREIQLALDALRQKKMNARVDMPEDLCYKCFRRSFNWLQTVSKMRSNVPSSSIEVL